MIPRTKREYLSDLVTEKNRWNHPLTAEEKTMGFLGWHQRGYLPHCDYPGLTQFVTFRLSDSMPASKKHEWEHLLAIEDSRTKREKLELYLDRGIGKCGLRASSVATIAQKTVLHFHGKRYDLLAWCVMPNHIHALINVWRTPLWKIIKSWKQHIARAANLGAERRPPARREKTPMQAAPALQWQREYWDTFMRNEAQQIKAIRYIENNPIKANLCKLPNEWAFSSARFRDQYQRLILFPQEGSAL